MPSPRTRNPTYRTDDKLFRDLTAWEVLITILVIVILYFIYWSRDNVRFTSNCPKCSATEFVKRKHRSFFAKKIIFFLRVNKLNCSRCNVTFYQAFSEK